MTEQEYPSSDVIRQQTDFLAEIATHPALRQILTEIAEAPPQERLATAERIAGVEALAARGVSIPPGLRITTRYFENPDALIRGDVVLKPTAEMFNQAAGGTLCVSLGELGLCVTYGWDVVTEA